MHKVWLQDFKYARLGEGRRFGFVLQKLFSYWDWPQTCLIFALILANFSFNGHVHKICVEGFQICEVGRLEEVWFLPTKYNIIWYDILSWDWLHLLFVFCNTFFSVKYYLHNIWVARFQICEVERLNRREWGKLWTRFREKEMLQNICSAKKKQTNLEDCNVIPAGSQCEISKRYPFFMRLWSRKRTVGRRE